MKSIDLEFSESICAYCVYNKEEKCGNIQKSNFNGVFVYKCINYRRKNIALKEFSEYIKYTFHDEEGKNIAILKKEVPEEILKQIKYKFDEVKNEEEKNMKSRIAENIMNEYNKKKRYEKNKRWKEMQSFQKENCINCKNKKTNLCEIKRNIEGKLQCVNKEI